MNHQQRITDAIQLIAAVPGYATVAADLSRTRIRYVPHLTDRAQTTLRRAIIIGPEPFADPGDAGLVSLAATLVHEHYHTRQNPFLKTFSFWLGIFTRTHPLRRYEAPAYARQLAFLDALAASHPPFAALARHERAAVLASFTAHYRGKPA